ncbi:hypothetical protein MPER_13113 [Moniliophthora perniciosa FA553]|nr:hypothetical protein MPER_13113 [Moniliophthora perniciosa FA553]
MSQATYQPIASSLYPVLNDASSNFTMNSANVSPDSGPIVGFAVKILKQSLMKVRNSALFVPSNSFGASRPAKPGKPLGPVGPGGPGGPGGPCLPLGPLLTLPLSSSSYGPSSSGGGEPGGPGGPGGEDGGVVLYLVLKLVHFSNVVAYKLLALVLEELRACLPHLSEYWDFSTVVAMRISLTTFGLVHSIYKELHVVRICLTLQVLQFAYSSLCFWV